MNRKTLISFGLIAAATLPLTSCLTATTLAASAGSAALENIDPTALFSSDAPRNMERGRVMQLSGTEQGNDSQVSNDELTVNFIGNITQEQQGASTMRYTYKRLDKQRATLEVKRLNNGILDSSALYNLYFTEGGKGNYTMQRKDAYGNTVSAGSGTFILN